MRNPLARQQPKPATKRTTAKKRPGTKNSRTSKARGKSSGARFARSHIISFTVIGLILFSAGTYAITPASSDQAAPQAVTPAVVHHRAASATKPTASASAKAVKQTTVTPTPPAPTPPPVAAPAPTPPPAATSVAPHPVAVVVPAPTSSVSGLTPTTPSTPSTPAPAPTSGATGGSSGAAPSPTQTTSSYSSLNWAGYVATSGNYTSVSGTWKAPAATGDGRSTMADATWVGIGGVASGDLIQVGTDNIVTPSGRVTTSAWYELLPDASIQITTMTIIPGDTISASVKETSTNQWLINIADISTGQSFSKTVTYASSRSSAEWIQEQPSYSNGQLVPLDTFSTVPFSNASMVGSGVTKNLVSGNAVPITLVTRNGQAVASPSAIGGDGSSFSVSRN